MKNLFLLMAVILVTACQQTVEQTVEPTAETTAEPVGSYIYRMESLGIQYCSSIIYCSQLLSNGNGRYNA